MALTYVAAAKVALSGRRSLALGGVFREGALVLASRAIALNPNDPEAHIAMAWAMITTGNPETGLSFVETAMRLNPHWPAHYFFARAMAYFAIGDMEQAAGILGEGLQRNPGAIELAPPLASMYAHLGQREKARETFMLWKPAASELALRNFPNIYFFPYRWPQDDRKVFDRLYDGLHIAVLPLGKDVPEVVQDLASEDPLTRINAAQTLGRFGSAAGAAVPDLIAALTDEFEDVRKKAALALGKIGPAAKDAIPALMAMQEESIVGHYAKEALKEIRGR
jgi:tetratricopeptide (TPR) repeat protein